VFRVTLKTCVSCNTETCVKFVFRVTGKQHCINNPSTMHMLHNEALQVAKFVQLPSGQDDTNRPARLAACSMVNICSNVCRNALLKWQWRNTFVFDLNSECFFITGAGRHTIGLPLPRAHTLAGFIVFARIFFETDANATELVQVRFTWHPCN